jgi:homoserine dehydrogenase
MTEKRRISLGLVGLGTVGQKVLQLFYNNRKIIAEKTGADIEFTRVCEKSESLTRKFISNSKFGQIKVTKNWNDIVRDPSIDIVIELIGGYEPAKTVIYESIKSGKHVVTANKAILSRDWDGIFTLVRKNQKLVYFEASVGAGIPVIQALNEGLAANRIDRIMGILNGTTNYILTKMLKDNLEFDAALVQTQKAGFAEKNPELDINGIDTLHKLTILSSIAWGSWVKPKNVYCEGLENLSLLDIRYAHDEFGYVTKLLGVARQISGRENTFEIFVRPCLLRKDHQFANVENEFNAILLNGNASGEIIFYGKGAGGFPAASAVVSDIIFLARQIAAGKAGSIPYISYDRGKKLDINDIKLSEGKYYLRFTTIEKPGVLSKISGILAKYEVSIASVYQKEQFSKYGRGVPILILTHKTKEGDLRAAVKEINSLPIVKNKTVMLKIEF